MPSLATVRASNASWKPSYPPVGVFVGGTSGIGEGIVEAFARHTKGNAHILIVGRNRAAATAIFARIEKPPAPDLTREFFECDLSLIANAKRTAAAIVARFPRVNFVFITAGLVSLNGLDVTNEGVDSQIAAMYYSKWALTDGLLPALHAARVAGEDARVAAVHTAGRGGPIDFDDLGLAKCLTGGMSGMQAMVSQLASYQDLMAEGFAERNPDISFTHAFPGLVDTPLLRKSPSTMLRAMYYVRYLVFPGLLWSGKSVAQCGEYQLHGLLQAKPGASRTGENGDDIGLGGKDDAHWEEGKQALWAHTEKIVSEI
ncbi:NAD(P)-binding protein [Mycena metata]|uniref:NAD(P)-binding protein n=1 Tax=Mycena metata TaxID=1033252 RepID=A0AAD7JAE7_9AGAR|nr:NAD(P)-binding protein [Mycena metata]